MSIKEILAFRIIDTTNFTLSIYHLLVIFLILAVVWVILRIIRRIFKRQQTRKRLEVGTSHSIYLIIKYLLWTFGIILSLDTIGIEITILLASSAALLVGLGLGLQQIFQDFISGITLIIEGTLKVGDIVETEKGDVGKVKEINMRTSKLETRDNIIVIVPNSKLINDLVINWSHIEKNTRFKVNVGVAYGSDVELVKTILLKCTENNKSIFTKPAPTVRFTDFGDSSLDFQLLFYTTETFRVEDIKSDLRFQIDAAFRENNIKIPFPQRDVHMYDK